MPNFQQVIVLGHLGNDPEVRHMPSGEAVANFSVATSEKWKDKNTGELREQTEWHRVSVFGKSAEAYVGKYLRKGDAVMVKGKLRTRKWQDQNGNDHYTTEIRADNFGGVQGMGGKKPQGGGQETAVRNDVSRNDPIRNDASRNDFYDEIPF